MVSRLQIIAFAPLHKTDMSQSFYLSAQIVKSRHFFNIFDPADQNSLEKTFHPFSVSVYSQYTAGPALLFQAVPGRKRLIEQHSILQRTRCKRIYVVWYQRWPQPF
ncbi:hypothetical protein D3C85_938620 [compost metagenome]